MSAKQPKPVLTGQRLKSRKRDLKEKYDPNGFRDELVEGLQEAEGNFEKASKFLDTAGATLDYRRYAEPLFDILITGGVLAPGGSVIDGPTNPIAVFALEDNDEIQSKHAQLVRDVLRRYKYLLVSLEEEMTKVLKFLKAFEGENASKLAKACAYYIHFDLISAKPLESLLNESLVKQGLSLAFMTSFFQTWLKQPNPAIASNLRKAGMESRLLEFMPPQQRSMEAFVEHCRKFDGLEELVKLQMAQATIEVRRSMKKQVVEMLDQEAPQDEIIAMLKDLANKNNIPNVECTVLVWDGLMAATEWNKKTDMVQEQALRHIKAHLKLLSTFCSDTKAQVTLMVSIQNYCYENQALLKAFPKIILLLYKGDVLEEDAVMDWYTKSHSPKGKGVFLEAMKEMIAWLKSAEEESEGED